MSWFYLVLGIIFLSLWYVVDLKRHPKRNCWWCKGSRRHYSRGWAGAFGNCWVCHGTGQRVRWGVLIFMKDLAGKIKAGQHGRNY